MTAPIATRLSDLVCVSFARGTRITLAVWRCSSAIEASGARRPGADPRPRRAAGALDRPATLRAVGAFAPVVIGRARWAMPAI